MERLTLDLSGIFDSETLHEYLSKMLNFPGYYGYNFDAFWDCISDATQATMPKTLTIEHLSQLEKLLPEDASKLKACLDEFALQYPDYEVLYVE